MKNPFALERSGFVLDDGTKHYWIRRKARRPGLASATVTAFDVRFREGKYTLQRWDDAPDAAPNTLKWTKEFETQAALLDYLKATHPNLGA